MPRSDTIYHGLSEFRRLTTIRDDNRLRQKVQKADQVAVIVKQWLRWLVL
jgi:hypothetical protein